MKYTKKTFTIPIEDEHSFEKIEIFLLDHFKLNPEEY